MKVRVVKNVGKGSVKTYGEVGTILEVKNNPEVPQIEFYLGDELVTRVPSNRTLGSVKELNDMFESWGDLYYDYTIFEEVKDESPYEKFLNRVKEGTVTFKKTRANKEELEVIMDFIQSKYLAESTELDITIAWRYKI